MKQVMNPKETKKSLSEVSEEPFQRFRRYESHIIKIIGIRQKWVSRNLSEDNWEDE